MKGTFISIWDYDTEISTPAELDENTGEIITENVEAKDVKILDKEYFEDENGNEYKVCPECHEFIFKTVMKEGVGKTLYEIEICSNPDCTSQDLFL